MRKGWVLSLAVFSVVSLTSMPVMADVSDYLGNNPPSSACPKTIVVKPDFSDKNVFYPVEAADFETAGNMIGAAVANKFEGATVIPSRDLDKYKACMVPVVLAKLKSYTKEPAIFGQYQGKMAVTLLHFKAPTSNAPDKTVDVSATGDRHWGDSVPFMNAVQAVAEKIQRTSM